MKASPQSQGVIIVNRRGLHARAAAKLVHLAGQFQATLTLEKDGQAAGGDSIMDLMMLLAGPGDRVTIKAMGPDAQAALKAIVALIQDGFGEIS